MSRPTNEPKQYALKVRVSEELRERIEEIALERGKSISEVVRDILNDRLTPTEWQETESQGLVPQGDKELENICLVYGISKERLIGCIKGLLNNEMLYVNEGKLCWDLWKIHEYTNRGQ